jgi:hypothetical protein
MMDKVRQETGSSQVMMDHEVPTTRLDQFARRIDAANQFEAMRVHNKTHAAEFEAAMCEPHTDEKNSRLELLSAVVWFSALARRADGTLERRGAVGHWKRSIDSHTVRRHRHGDCLRRVQEAHAAFPPTFSTLSLQQGAQSVEIAYGFKMWSIPCNMDVESFCQPFIALAKRLIVGFGLGYKDAASVLCAFADPMHSAGCVSLASRTMLANKKTYKKKNDLGYHLAVIISHLDGNIRAPPLRFGKKACSSRRTKPC